MSKKNTPCLGLLNRAVFSHQVSWSPARFPGTGHGQGLVRGRAGGQQTEAGGSGDTAREEVPR